MQEIYRRFFAEEKNHQISLDISFKKLDFVNKPVNFIYYEINIKELEMKIMSNLVII
jgi:hypothetical protein